MALEPAHYWIILAAVLLALEAFGAPGMGFLFAGLAAAATGLLIYGGAIDSSNITLQAAIFMGLTGLFAAILWKKLKQWSKSSSGGYHNMIGDLATIGKGGIARGSVGQASWSGTTMMAELAADVDAEMLSEGSVVEIVSVKGNVLIVAPKHTA